MARPVVLAVGLVLGVARGTAAAGKTSKVRIETEPEGAKVYLNVKEDGSEVCTTPCVIDAPIGETPIIIEAENRRSIIENLVVPKKTAKPMRVSYKLKPAFGTLVIDGGDGGAITLDDQDQGTAPRRFEQIVTGPHHVVVEKDGKKLYDAVVKVEIGHEASVAVPAPAPNPERPPVRSQPELPAITATRDAPAGPRRQSPLVAISAATDIGWRQFTFNYHNAAAPRTQQNDREGGEIQTGAIVEVWPTTLLGLGVLPGLEVFGRFEIGVNPQPVTLRDPMGKVVNTSLDTSWRTLEISVRHRWRIANAGTVEAGAGYIDDRYRFTADDPVNGPAQLATVPDVSYKAARVGGRASLLVGRLEPYLAADDRIALSGGRLERRYSHGASAVGYHGALGALVHLGGFEVRAEGAVTLYSWTFRPDVTDPDQAQSGSDVIEQFGVSVGYVY